MRGMWVFAVVGAFALSACDIFNQDDGRIDLQLVDSPYTDASEVVITITGVELNPHDDDRQTITFENPIRVDLLTLQNGQTQSLLSDERVPSGDYDSVRLLVRSSKTSTTDSWVTVNGSRRPLYVSGADDDALVLDDDFSVDDEDTTSFTLDIDLRRALLKPDPDDAPNAYRLESALRIVNNDDAGTLSGRVDSSLRPGNCIPALYLYRGNVSSGQFGDIGGNATEPFATAPVSNGDGSYSFRFLPEGSYTAALTCQANADDPEDDDDLVFTRNKRLDVDAGRTTTVNFP
ncbi:MAG: DUF4382 domain-containing protein [Solimonas sp.]